MTTTIPLTRSPAEPTVLAGLGPLILLVFCGFMAVAAPLAALPVHVQGALRFGPITVGWIVGLQSIATVLTRPWAGALCDRQGPRRVVLLGLPLASASGLLYLASAVGPVGPRVALAVLVVGRLAMGLAESLFITGAMSWGIARLGPPRTGTVMSWQGIAMYAALGIGGPFGLALQADHGFAGVAMVAILAPLAALGVALTLPAVPATGGRRGGAARVLGVIWRPGLVLSLAAVPFAAMATFVALDFAAKGWPHAGLALAGFGAGYVAVRLLGSQLPDRHGAIAVAAGSVAIEALGQGLLWQAPQPVLALAGATLTGVGFSLVFPAMGVVATRAVPAQNRGRAVGTFIAFFDLAVGATGPAVGLIVSRWGDSAAAFGVGAGATLLAMVLLADLRRRPQP